MQYLKFSIRPNVCAVFAIALTTFFALVPVTLATSPATTSTFHTDPDAVADASGMVWRKELSGFPNYGANDSAADIIYTGQAATWKFSKHELTLPLPAGIQTGPSYFRAFLSADDSDCPSAAAYTFKVYVNGIAVQNKATLTHGAPYSRAFTNWQHFDYSITVGDEHATFAIENTSGLRPAGCNSGPWIGVDAIEFHWV